MTPLREEEWSRQTACAAREKSFIPSACVLTSPYVNCFGRTVLYVCTEYCVEVNMYHVSAQGVDERMTNVHYCYYYY